MSEVLIRLDHVGKDYPLLNSGGRKLAHLWAVMRRRSTGDVYRALQDVNLQVVRGESLGLVGVNGAGKSTLLKLIAGVVKPTSGELLCQGRVGALLELGAGFHPEYTGRENVFLACALMGLSRAQTQERLDGILSFADIGAHIDQPIKHYSSGMVVRLGFAVATCVTPDVLITDEVLAVGDESFQKKCIAWMERYREQGGTLLLCSHSMYHVQKLCQHAVWIDGGRVRMHDSAAEVTRAYLAWHEEKSRPSAPSADAKPSGLYLVKQMLLNGLDPVEPLNLQMGDSLTVSGTVHSPDGRVPNVAVGLARADGTPIYGLVSDMDGFALRARGDGLFDYALRFDALPLLPGRYVAKTHAMDPEGLRLFDHVERSFDIQGSAREMGYVRLPHHWFYPDKT